MTQKMLTINLKILSPSIFVLDMRASLSMGNLPTGTIDEFMKNLVDISSTRSFKR